MSETLRKPPQAAVHEPRITGRTDGAYDGTTYYGRPSLKPAPFENWVVGGYIFLAGLSGAAQVIASLADAAGVAQREGLVRRGRWLSMLAPTLGSALLIYDLHTPKRFYNMLRIVRPTSPMSMGTWLLMGFSAFSGLSAALRIAGGWLPRWARALWRAERVTQIPAAVAGAGMSTYTASLLTATSTPLWAAAPRELAVQFGSSSIAAGAAALSLGERRWGSRKLARDLDTVALAALLVELGASVAAETTWQRKGISAAKDAAMPTRMAGKAGMYLPIGLHAASVLLGRRQNALSQIASIATLAGSLCMRVGVMQAGDESAQRPGDAFRLAKPGNLPK